MYIYITTCTVHIRFQNIFLYTKNKKHSLILTYSEYCVSPFVEQHRMLILINKQLNVWEEG